MPSTNESEIEFRMTVTKYKDGQLRIEGIPPTATDAYGLIGIALEFVIKKRLTIFFEDTIKDLLKDKRIEVPRIIPPEGMT